MFRRFSTPRRRAPAIPDRLSTRWWSCAPCFSAAECRRLLITGPHLSYSARMSAAKSSGVLLTGAAPSLEQRD